MSDRRARLIALIKFRAAAYRANEDLVTATALDVCAEEIAALLPVTVAVPDDLRARLAAFLQAILSEAGTNDHVWLVAEATRLSQALRGPSEVGAGEIAALRREPPGVRHRAGCATLVHPDLPCSCDWSAAAAEAE